MFKLLLIGNGKKLLLESIVITVLLLFATAIPLYASQVTLAWDANNPAPDGYQVFQRAEGASYNYNSPVWSGKTATCTLNNLAYNTTYYFVVRAYAGTTQSTNSNQVTFRRDLPVYQISASAGANGSISPSGTVNVNQGANHSFTITPNIGHRVANVMVNGQSVGAVTAYTFSNVTKNHTIAASFTPITYHINATAGTNGTLSPSGQIAVVHGGSQTFSIKPDQNCHVANVIVNGQSVGAVSTYTFSNITSNCTITASFVVQTHTITAGAGAGGAITPAGSTTVLHGGHQGFTITPLSGYRVRDVLIDGVSIGNVSTYNFSAVSKDHSIMALFEAINNDDRGSGSTNAVFGNSPDVDHPGTVQDTFLNINSSVNASSTQLNTYTWPAQKAANAILMKFDLSRIPAGARIQSATLTLYQIAAGGDTSYNVSLHKIINHNPDLSKANGFTFDGVNNWTANNQCHNNVPLGQADVTAPEDVNRLDRSNGYKNWDVTGMVQAWVNDSGANFGLMLNSDATASADSFRSFASSGAANTTIRPFLEVTYSQAEATNVIFGDTPDADYPGTVQDTFLNINSSVNASSTQLHTYTWPTNRPANAILIKFDLSQLPADAQIESANLTLHQIAAGGDTSYDVSAQRITKYNPDLRAANGFTYDGVNSWTANNLAFNSIPLGQADVAAPADVNRLDRSNGLKNWDITGMVQDWVKNSGSNYGLMLNSDAVASADSFRSFASSGAANAALRPTLEITYTRKK